MLWEEYASALLDQGAQAYKYTSFCVKYRAWALGLKRSMRQTHLAGEKLFVDYAGQTVPLVDAATGEITAAQIFVATLGASNYTYACATRRQTTADWIGAQIQALEFFGGVPRLIVPDQARALIKRPDRYEPEPNALYDEFAAHYGCALLAARPAHPRDKPKVENAVLVVERWILARLRNRRFFSLAELNAAIALLLVDLNQRPFKKLPGCRRSAHCRLRASSCSAGRPPRSASITTSNSRATTTACRTGWWARRWSCASRPSWWRPSWPTSVWPAMPAAPSVASTPPWPSTCPRRTGRTWSGRRPS